MEVGRGTSAALFVWGDFMGRMSYAELAEAARGQMGNCKACPVCDGRACRNRIPGPGAKGTGTVAIRNYEA